MVYVGTLGTFNCKGDSSHLPEGVVEEERKKRGFDSQLVLYKFRLNPKKDLIADKKAVHKFDMQTRNYTNEFADGATLKESADGTSLIFLSNFRSLVFDIQTL